LVVEIYLHPSGFDRGYDRPQTSEGELEEVIMETTEKSLELTVVASVGKEVPRCYTILLPPDHSRDLHDLQEAFFNYLGLDCPDFIMRYKISEIRVMEG